MTHATAGPPTQHQDLPQIEPPASAPAMAARLARLTQAVTETQDRALGLALDLGAFQAELGALLAGARAMATDDPGPPYTDPPRTPAEQAERDSAATGRALARDTKPSPPRTVSADGVWPEFYDGDEHSEYRAPTGARPRPVAVVIGADPAWPFAGRVL